MSTHSLPLEAGFAFDQAHNYFASRLTENRVPHRAAFNVRCPFHDDRTASMSINLDKGGLWKCHACDFGGGIYDFEKRMSPNSSNEELWESIYKLTGATPTPQDSSRQKRQLVATYPYVDPAGKLLFQKLRYDPKSFALRSPDGSGGWRYSLDGVRRVLYNLPEVLTSQFIFIAEGEKDVESIRVLNINVDDSKVAATCNFDGAGKWSEEYSPYFAGKRVAIFPDNDEPGRQHAQAVARSVSAYAEVVKIVELPGLIEKGDVTDYLKDHTKDDLLRAIKEAPRYLREEHDLSALQVIDDGWPRLPEAALHGLAGEVVTTIAPHSEADNAALLIQFLVAFGNLVGPGPHCRVEASRHGLNLFAVLVGDTSKGRKGTSWSHISGLLNRVDNVWAANRVTGGLSSAEGLINEVRDQDAPTDRRLLVTQGEFASVLRVMAREGNNLSGTLRDAWDKGNLRTLVKNNPLKATDAHISLVGHITRTELLKYLNETESHNGFANRLLFTCVKRSKYLPEGGSVPEHELQRLASRIAAAVDWLQSTETPRFFQRDDEARELWRYVYPELSSGLPGLLGAATSRAESQVLRLSAIYAALDRSETIRVEHLKAALAVWDYCLHSAKLIFGGSLGDAVADRIREALETAGKDGMTRTEIRDLFKRNCSASRVEQALRQLVALGMANKRKIDSGGKPIEVWNLTT